jgi:hypothetical protein
MKNALESLLEDDHESLAQLLAELHTELAKPNITRAFELLDSFWARLAVHIRAEHLHLFPAVADASASLFTGKESLPTPGQAHELLLHLRSDHNFFMTELARLVQVMREVAANPSKHSVEIEEVRKAMIAIAQRLEIHNRLEEEQLYLWPALLFDETTVANLRERLKHELENLPPRFAAGVK